MSYNSYPSNQLYGAQRYNNMGSMNEGGSGERAGGNGSRGGRTGRYQRKRKYQQDDSSYSNGGNGMNSNNNQSSRNNHNNNSSGSNGEETIFFELGKNKRATVRQFRNINLVDLREYYQDSSSGEMKPGKKGISLNEEQYDELLQNRLQIDDALRRFGSTRRRFKLVPLDDYDSGMDYRQQGQDPQGGNGNGNGHDGGSLAGVKEIEMNKRNRMEKKTQPHPPQLPMVPIDDQLIPLEVPKMDGAPKKEDKEKAMNPRLDDASANPRLDSKESGEKSKKTTNGDGKKNGGASAATENPRLDKGLSALPTTTNTNDDDDLNSSDEDFAQALESEVRKRDEDISEEE